MSGPAGLEDTDVDPELIDALAHTDVDPEEIKLIQGEDGRTKLVHAPKLKEPGHVYTQPGGELGRLTLNC